MTFPCLICGELPIVLPSEPMASSTPSSSSSSGVARSKQNQSQPSGGGTTIRTLSKDMSDKIFQNLCRHLDIKFDKSFIQNPGEQMPLCAICSAAVLEIYTLQTKVDHLKVLIKKYVWRLERIVADTEIATNWLATKEEEEHEEAMWSSLPCPQQTIRIARERHDKFRNQILQNFKSKVKQRMKLRAAGQPDYDILDGEPTFQVSSSQPVAFENGERSEGITSYQNPNNPPSKKAKLDKNAQKRTHQSPVPSLSPACTSVGGIPFLKTINTQVREGQESRQINQQTSSVNITSSRSKGNPNQEYHDESEMSDYHEQAYPDVQIVCTAGPVDYDIYKDETEMSGDGDESMEQEGNLWYTGEENMEDEESMVIPEGEDVVWLAHNVVLRKGFLEQLLIENLKPSVFLRKLMFAVFGLKQIANSSGTTGSNKPGAKPSLDRNKFETLRDYTIDTYGIRDNLQELDDLNRKIRTICCDARKALKRKAIKTEPQPLEGFSSGRSVTSGPTSTHAEDFPEVPSADMSTEDVFHMTPNSGNDPVSETKEQM